LPPAPHASKVTLLTPTGAVHKQQHPAVTALVVPLIHTTPKFLPAVETNFVSSRFDPATKLSALTFL
jgi:hypothetical protein